MSLSYVCDSSQKLKFEQNIQTLENTVRVPSDVLCKYNLSEQKLRANFMIMIMIVTMIIFYSPHLNLHIPLVQYHTHHKIKQSIQDCQGSFWCFIQISLIKAIYMIIIMIFTKLILYSQSLNVYIHLIQYYTH